MTYNYQKICANLLKNLPQRTTNVIERRFGLKTGKRETLEVIGQSHGITRERVRQIENEGFSKIKSKAENYQEVFQFFAKTLDLAGGLKREDVLLSSLGGEKAQNHVFFLLTLAGGCQRFSEDENFYPFWARKKEAVKLAKKVISLTLKNFKKDKRPFALDELFGVQKIGLAAISKEVLDKEVFNSYLEISKKIEENPESKIGLRDWIEINPRGIKDRAYLVLKREEKPLHFSEITKLIEKLPFLSQRKTHIATVHNELIKDSRFVLVGRGLYALSEWGYAPGVVKDIISKVLKESKGPLSKEAILKKVLEQRFVKENTVLLNLHDKNYFARDAKGRYQIKEA